MDGLGPVGHQERLAVAEVLDGVCVVVVEDPPDDLGVVVPGQTVPDQPITLGDVVFFHVGRALADADDAQPVFPAAFPDLDEHLPDLAHRPLLGHPLVALLDEHQERLFLLFGLGEQLLRDFRQQRLGLFLVEERRDVQDDGDVLLQGQRGDLARVVLRDLDVTLLVAADVEDLVLLFEAVVLPVDVDDEQPEPVVEQFLRDDARGVALPAPALPGDEAAASEQFDDRQVHGSVGVRVSADAGARVGDGYLFGLCHSCPDGDTHTS